MMKLSLMQRVVETVNGEWVSPLADEVLRPWDYDAGTAFFFRASANFVWVVKRHGKRHFLRFAADSERSRQAVDSEIAIVEWLHNQGVKVARAVPSKSGRLVETVRTSMGTFHAVLFEGLEGTHLDPDEQGEPIYPVWGAALGSLHNALSRCPDALTVARPTWRDHLEWAAAQLPRDEVAPHRELERLLRWGETLPVSPQTFGVIHYDFESDNLRQQGERLAILDFDDSARYWFAADIGFALWDLLREDRKLDHPLFRRFVDGYRSVRAVSEEELSVIPFSLRINELWTYARLLRSNDLPVEGENRLQSIADKLRNGCRAILARLETYPQ